MIRAASVAVVLGLMAGSALGTDIAPGDWRLTIPTEIGELPINLTLSRDHAGWHATFVNGPEHVAAETIAVNGDGLTIAFPSYDSRLEARLAADGTITGQLTLHKRRGVLTFPLTGTAGARYRFFPTHPATAAPIAGRWALTLVDDGTESHGLAEFTQRGSTVDGVTMFFSDDSRYLHGEMRGDDLSLSTFDGGQGSLWTAHRNPDGSLSGKTFGLGDTAAAPWTAHLDPDAQLEDPNTLTYLKPGADTITFTFPNLDGKPVSLDDPAYKGKVVIVTIGGSWCPTCHDEAAFLAPYAKANRVRGLEVIGLMYEYSDDFGQASAACRKFKARYDIPWQMLIAGRANKEAASRTLPMINAVLVYPTMIVIDRKGKVRRIHTGFPGPATGAHHEEFVREFTKLMDALLAEPG